MTIFNGGDNMTETKAIDTHAHLWNEDYLDKLGKLGSPRY